MTNNKIQVFILNYNGKNTILPTIESIYKSEDVEVALSVVDDHSNDGSPDLVRQNYPEIPVHILPYNTKKVNALRNKALEIATSEYVVITDSDIEFDRRCIAEMFKVMEIDEKIATCTPRLMYWDQPEKIYLAGTRVHFIGAAISDQRDKLYNENYNKEPTTNSGSGICLIRYAAVQKVGGFDGNFLAGWGNDGEFYQRLLRAGYKCLFVPTAFGLHENKLVVTNRKFRVIGATYNRWVFILSHYSVKLIILLIPVFILYEIFQLGFVLLKGIAAQYFKGNFLVIKNFSMIREKRKFVQKLKVVPDKEVLFSGNIYVAPALIEKHKLIKFAVSSFSSFLNFYWKIIKRFI